RYDKEYKNQLEKLLKDTQEKISQNISDSINRGYWNLFEDIEITNMIDYAFGEYIKERKNIQSNQTIWSDYIASGFLDRHEIELSERQSFNDAISEFNNYFKKYGL